MNTQIASGDPAWRRVAIGSGAGMLVGMGLGRFSFAAMIPALVEAGQLTAVQAGRIGMVNLLGFFIGVAVSVRVQQWLRVRPVLICALFGACLALAASALPWGVVWLAAWRAVVGLATGIIMALGITLVAATAPIDRRPAGAGYMYGGVGIGILISGTAVPRLLSYGIMEAWIGLAVFSLVAAVAATWGWSAVGPNTLARPTTGIVMRSPWVGDARWRLFALLVANLLFSMSIVPHTLYWVDYVSRGLGLGIETGGLHWSLVGVMSIVGPGIATWLASRIGTHAAVVVAFLLIGFGVAAPAVVTASPILIASSALFGAQPGLAALLTARARDLVEADAVPRLMRAMILANATGAVLGGLAMPWIYDLGGRHAPLFLIAGGALLVSALLTWPGGSRVSTQIAGTMRSRDAAPPA